MTANQTYPLPPADQTLAVALSQKMLKVAGKERPEIIAMAAFLVIQVITFVHDKKGMK